MASNLCREVSVEKVYFRDASGVLNEKNNAYSLVQQRELPSCSKE
jgi:hypothetical protein